jgi:hypothetical protein
MYDTPARLLAVLQRMAPTPVPLALLPGDATPFPLRGLATEAAGRPLGARLWFRGIGDRPGEGGV